LRINPNNLDVSATSTSRGLHAMQVILTLAGSDLYSHNRLARKTLDPIKSGAKSTIMKKTLFLPAALAFAMFVGCGSKTEQTAGGPAKVGEIASTPGANGTLSNGQLVLPSEPKEIVRVFLDAMREGKGEQLAALFSTNARAEIQKQGIKIEPPGSAQATFVIGDAAPQGDAMLVSSLWKEPPATPGEVPQEMEVVWELRKEAAGWRVCGMAVDPGTGEEYEVVNFEKLDQPETGVPQSSQTRMASLPQGAPAVPASTPVVPPANSMNYQTYPGSGLPNSGLPNSGLPNSGLPNSGLPAGLPQGGFPSGSQSTGGLPPASQPVGGLPQNGLPAGLPPSGR